MLRTKSRPCPSTGGLTFIVLSEHKVAIVDPENKPELDKFNWTVKVCHGVMYAVRRVYKPHGDFTIYMHRQIMLTPRGMVCHHRNKNGLDNRKSNLRNLLKDEHRYIHQYGDNCP